jgi:ABC-type nitrate/sulfonate/bicarbonate transport system substrate-binding protein
MQVNRRNFGLGVLAGAAFVATGGMKARAAGSGTIRLGYLYPNLTTLAYGIADHIGAYKNAGLDVQAQPFNSGQTVEGIQSLWRGDLDVYYGGGPEIPHLNSRLIEAGNAVPLAVISASNPGHTNFVLSNKNQPKSFDELVGKPLRIGVSSPSSDHLALFRGWLTVEKKLTTKELGWQFLTVEGGNMPTALLTDQLDGFLHSEPTTSLAILNKGGHLFMTASRGDFGANPPPMTFMASSHDFMSKNGDTLRAFMKATQSANDFYKKTSKEEMIPIISKWSGTKPDVLQEAYQRINPNIGMSHDQAQKWWDFVGTAMVGRGELSKKMDPFRDVFDLSFQAA